MTALMDPVAVPPECDTYAPTGGVYWLASDGARSAEPISFILSGLVEEAPIAAPTDLSDAITAAVKRWTSAELLAALMIGAALTVPMPTPALHASRIETFAPRRGADAAETTSTTSETPGAYRAFKELGGWLNAGDDQVADMLGIGRTTAYTWHREGREPRPETARRLYEYHAVLDSLRRHLGSSELQMWLREGSPSRHARLLAGELSSLDHDVHEVLFHPSPNTRPDLGWAPEPASGPAMSDPSAPTLRRAGRRPRRARLT